jgi:hypothetical protein
LVAGIDQHGDVVGAAARPRDVDNLAYLEIVGADLLADGIPDLLIARPKMA